MGFWQGIKQALFGEPVPSIEARALADRLRGADAPLLLDVRTTAEFEQSHIDGARHVPLQELARRLDSLALPRDRQVVAICLSAHRSVPAVRMLQARGHEDAAQLAGGMAAWWRAGLPVRSGAAR